MSHVTWQTPKGVKRRPPSAPSPARKLAKTQASPAVKAFVKKHIDKAHEVKNFDTSSQFSLSTSSANFLLLNNITQGAGGTQRLGRTIKVVGLDVTINVVLHTSQITGDSFRFIFFKDNESRGANPTLTDVLDDATFGRRAIVSDYSMSNVVVGKRFVIYEDFVLDLNPSVMLTSTTVGGTFRTVSKNLRFQWPWLAKFYDTTGGGIADVDSGALCMFAMQTGGTNASTVDAYFRVKFIDP